MRRYRNISHRPVEGIEPGKEGELELGEAEESDFVRQGRLEIVPSEYQVTGPRNIFGHEPGSKFSMSMSLGQEMLLVEGEHIARVEVKPRKRADKEG